MTPSVTVLMPVRDAVGTIDRALASLAAQTLETWEAVVVDDGSTDGTAARLQAWAARDPRVCVVPRPAEGIVAALNAGLGRARGTFVARLDADDEAFPDRLESQARFLAGAPAVGLVGGLVEYGGDARVTAGYAHHVDWLNSVLTENDIRLNRFVEAPFAHPSVMFRHALVSRFGGYRQGDFPEDYELWLRWAEAGVRLAKLPQPVVRWHDAPGRLSRTDSRYRPEAFYRLKAAYLARELARVAGGRELWICGAGRPTRRRASFLEAEGVRLAGYVDVDPRKIGGVVAGRPVVGPDALPPPARAFALGYVGTRGAREKIRALLAGQGRGEGRDFLLAA